MRLANIMDVPLVDCTSHRLNLAVKRFLEPHEEDLENVQVLMRKLSTLKEAAKLRAKTPLLPARELFDGHLELKPSFASYLASNAEIVH
ncbi:hypothetical protein PC115_g17852 [Phytophthora cactorum]|uniref:Uncharacterized protein n=1 Tax=Phytophthora cactorum TaxID=29920 RepID=A0A8T1B345_9STRA|nr:hypothetical protein PC115_g17852 [Phytophthora cactorum]